MTRRKGSKDYPNWMKRESLRLYLGEGLPAAEILHRFSIADRNRFNAWARQYQEEGEEMFANKRSCSGRKPKRENTTVYIARLEMELDLLKKFYTELRQGSLAKRDIGLFFTEYPVACHAGSALEQNLYPKGQNFVIRRPLAAGIEILKILQVY